MSTGDIYSRNIDPDFYRYEFSITVNYLIFEYGQSTAKKASKKELILQKAATMFRQKGFAATSMRDLAETVGIEAASLYNHIQSKSEILQEITYRISMIAMSI